MCPLFASPARRRAPLLVACMLAQAGTGFVAPTTKNAWRAVRVAERGPEEWPTATGSFFDAVKDAWSELQAYTPEAGELATQERLDAAKAEKHACLLYTSPSPRD